MKIMISLLEARKNVPLVVKSVQKGRRYTGSRDRRHTGGRHGGKGKNYCRRFSDMGIREGVTITKISMHPFFGPVVVGVGNCKIAVGRGMASTIFVEEVVE